MANSATRGETVSTGSLPEPVVPVVLSLAIANAASGDNDFTGLIGRHEVVGFEVLTLAAGDVGNKYTLKNGSTAITDDVTPGASANTVARAATIDPAANVIADGGTLRISHVLAGGSSLARCRVWLLPLH